MRRSNAATWPATRLHGRSTSCLTDTHALNRPSCNRDPDKTLFIFQSPAIFEFNPHTRLYGWLLGNYRADSSAISRDLPHRNGLDCGSLADRIGWLTWEDCEAVLAGSCKWLSRETTVPPVSIRSYQPTAIPSTILLPYALNAGFDRKTSESLIADFESNVKRDVDRMLPRKLRQELLESTLPRDIPERCGGCRHESSSF